MFTRGKKTLVVAAQICFARVFIVLSTSGLCGCKALFSCHPQDDVCYETSAQQLVMPSGSGYLTTGVTLTGEHLGANPSMTATERALELLDEVHRLQSRNSELEIQLETMRKELQQRDQLIRRVESELTQTKTEIFNARRALEKWREEQAAIQRRLGARERDQLAEMDELSAILSQLILRQKQLQNDGNSDDATEARSSRFLSPRDTGIEFSDSNFPLNIP